MTMPFRGADCGRRREPCPRSSYPRALRDVSLVLASLAGAATCVGLAAQQPAERPAAPPMPALLQSYHPVTAERLKKPADEDWLMIRGTYDGWGFSPLAQITPPTSRAAAGMVVRDRRWRVVTRRRLSSTTA